MWKRPITAMIATATIVALVTVMPAAWADGPGEPLYGDLDADGVTDRARLGAAARSCAVLVELGRPQGGFLPARSYLYRVPGRRARATCPDLGVAVDLDDAPAQHPGPAELVLGWYDGNPGRRHQNLLVLRDYQVATVLSAFQRPNVIGLADFDGDRRRDVYLWTDQGEGFATFLNAGTGTLTPGPVRYCARHLDHRFADFDRDRAMDVVIAFIDNCADGSRGVVVVLDDGTVVDLQRTPDDRSSWTVHLLNADRNDVPDVVTYQQPSGQVGTFLGVGNGTFVSAPLAVRDVATVTVAGSIQIPVLANDWASQRARVSVVVAPAHGAIEIHFGRTIVYRPDPAAAVTDRFVYRITQDGHTSDAAVLVKIAP